MTDLLTLTRAQFASAIRYAEQRGRQEVSGILNRYAGLNGHGADALAAVKSLDASGHEHKPAGHPDGGQFTGHGESGGSESPSAAKPAAPAKLSPADAHAELAKAKGSGWGNPTRGRLGQQQAAGPVIEMYSGTEPNRYSSQGAPHNVPFAAVQMAPSASSQKQGKEEYTGGAFLYVHDGFKHLFRKNPKTKSGSFPSAAEAMKQAEILYKVAVDSGKVKKPEPGTPQAEIYARREHEIADVQAEHPGREILPSGEVVPEGNTTCPKCGGAGILSQFSHVSGGECFSCDGTGFVEERTRKSVTWVEGQHPRDKNGEFIKKNEVDEARGDAGKMNALRERVRPEDRHILEEHFKNPGHTGEARAFHPQAQKAGVLRDTGWTRGGDLVEHVGGYLDQIADKGPLDAYEVRDVMQHVGGMVRASRLPELRNILRSMGVKHSMFVGLGKEELQGLIKDKVKAALFDAEVKWHGEQGKLVEGDEHTAREPVVAKSVDASGHEHKPAGHPDGGQFTGQAGGGFRTLPPVETDAEGKPSRKVEFGPDTNVVIGHVHDVPITVMGYDKGIINKVSAATRKMLESTLADPEVRQAMKAAGITHLSIDETRGEGKPKTWTMGMTSYGTLLFHPQTAKHLAASTDEYRKAGGLKRVIFHEAGHNHLNNAPAEKQKALRSAVEKHPEVAQEIGKIVNLRVPPGSWSDDAKERVASEVHAELQAMRQVAPERYAKMPDDLRAAVEAIYSPGDPARVLPDHLRSHQPKWETIKSLDLGAITRPVHAPHSLPQSLADAAVASDHCGPLLGGDAAVDPDQQVDAAVKVAVDADDVGGGLA